METVLAGDPAKAGPITLQAWFPVNYKMRAYTHPGVENVTVIKGSFSPTRNLFKRLLTTTILV